MANQARGLAEAIGLPVQVKTVKPRLPWTLLPVTAWPAPFAALGPGSTPLTPPWPRIAVGCGRRAIPYVLAIKRLSKGATFTVQLQHPRVDPRVFDLVVPPEHDGLAGANVMPILGSPNGVTASKLAAARAQWPALAHLPHPRVAVLVGGKSKSHSFGEADAQVLAASLKALRDQGAGLMLTASRRTGEAQTRILRDALNGPNAFVWDGAGDNPYFGLLAHADAILVTSDSTNMAVEAAATGKPVYIVAIPGGDVKFDRLHRALEAQGIARPFAGKIEQWNYAPLAETERVARAIREKIGLKG